MEDKHADQTSNFFPFSLNPLKKFNHHNGTTWQWGKYHYKLLTSKQKYHIPNELSAVSSITASELLCIVKCRISKARKMKLCNLGKLLWRSFR